VIFRSSNDENKRRIISKIPLLAVAAAEHRSLNNHNLEESWSKSTPLLHVYDGPGGREREGGYGNGQDMPIIALIYALVPQKALLRGSISPEFYMQPLRQSTYAE
jgi:hypothetical protein